jgi:hypothetical protein
LNCLLNCLFVVFFFFFINNKKIKNKKINKGRNKKGNLYIHPHLFMFQLGEIYVRVMENEISIPLLRSSNKLIRIILWHVYFGCFVKLIRIIV